MGTSINEKFYVSSYKKNSERGTETKDYYNLIQIFLFLFTVNINKQIELFVIWKENHSIIRTKCIMIYMSN